MTLLRWLVVIAFSAFILFVATCIGVIIWTKLEHGKYNQNTPLLTLEYSQSYETELTQEPIKRYKLNLDQQELPDLKFVSRPQWKGLSPTEDVTQNKNPTKYVIIAHTAGGFCKTKISCSRITKSIQNYHISVLKMADIKYNFLIGGDNNVYIGLGWDLRLPDKDDIIMIAFFGNYIYDELTPSMIEATKELLNLGESEGRLTHDYKILAHNHTANTLSPGRHVYEVIKNWPHFTTEQLEK